MISIKTDEVDLQINLTDRRQVRALITWLDAHLELTQKPLHALSFPAFVKQQEQLEKL